MPPPKDDPGPERPAWVPPALYGSTGFLLAMAGAESRRRWAQGLARWQLRPAHYGVLMALQDGGRSQQELAALVGVDPRNLVPIVDALERRGAVERRPHPTDRRRHEVTLGEAGRELLAQVRSGGESIERDMLAPLDEPERAQLQALLLKLLDPA